MNRKIYSLLILIIAWSYSEAQSGRMKNDTFYFSNDTALNHIVVPTRNDTITSLFSLNSVEAMTGIATYQVVESNNIAKIRITDPDTSSYMGSFRYIIRYTATSLYDTGLVYFFKSKLPSSLHPGDVNNDGIVNHFDLIPIGIKYGKSGSPRHERDRTFSAFNPVPVGNWSTATRNVNDKYIDIDGDGIIDTNDSKALPLNFKKSWNSTTIPLLSAPSFSTTLTARLPQDTIDFSGNRISLPVSIINQTPIQSYGIAFTYQLKVLNKNTGNDTLYADRSTVSNFNLWNEKPLIFFEKDASSYYVAAVKTNGKNGPTDGYAGVVEIVVEDILIGIAKLGDVGRFTIDFKEVLLVDNAHTPIDITPKPYTFYARKVASGISNNVTNDIQVFPTFIENDLMIEKSNLRKVNYQIYNSIGLLMHQGILEKEQTKIESGNWSPGVYYLKLDAGSKTFKVQKR